jgi:hypothetical protein
MKKYIYISFTLAIFLFLSAEKSFACSCMFTPDPLKKQIQNAFFESDAVFSGKVVEVKDSPDDKYRFIVKLKAAKFWKGTAAQEITITTEKDGAMCGFNFETGKNYLVYAYGKKDELLTNNCSRTSIFSQKGDGKYLDKLKRKKKYAK